MSSDPFELIVAPTTRRQLADTLPESVVFAALEFIVGPLLKDPYRVGGPLRAPLDGQRSARRGTYRVIYRIDDDNRRVTVTGVFGRANANQAR